jgi:hypothetical protein
MIWRELRRLNLFLAHLDSHSLPRPNYWWSLRPDNKANRKPYGKSLTKAIVPESEVPPPPSALELLAVLNSEAASAGQQSAFTKIDD